jgi:hypothetical protein
LLQVVLLISNQFNSLKVATEDILLAILLQLIDTMAMVALILAIRDGKAGPVQAILESKVIVLCVVSVLV